MSDALKTLGNLHYANKEYEKAFKVYSEALEFETDPIATSRILSNRAAALLRLDRPVEGTFILEHFEATLLITLI